ncbi:hypothetical protein FCIRC_14025, partial [Fusarium circinatum]
GRAPAAHRASGPDPWRGARPVRPRTGDRDRDAGGAGRGADRGGAAGPVRPDAGRGAGRPRHRRRTNRRGDRHRLRNLPRNRAQPAQGRAGEDRARPPGRTRRTARRRQGAAGFVGGIALRRAQASLEAPHNPTDHVGRHCGGMLPAASQADRHVQTAPVELVVAPLPSCARSAHVQ